MENKLFSFQGSVSSYLQMTLIQIIFLYIFPVDHVENKQHKRQIELFQEKAVRELNEYAKQEYSDQPDRVLRLLLRLPSLRSLSPDVMEELFFAGLIGNVQIDSIIPYILKMETGEYNSQMGLGGGSIGGGAEGEEEEEVEEGCADENPQEGLVEIKSINSIASGQVTTASSVFPV